MSPERLEQQRQHDRTRGKKYSQEHKDERTEYAREWYEQNKEDLPRITYVRFAAAATP